MPIEINATLQQQGKLGQVREYQIIKGKELRIIHGSVPRQRVHMVHLLALADKSRLRFNIAWGWFYLVVGCALGLVAYLIARAFIPAISSVVEFGIIAVLVLGMILGVILVLINFTRVRVFYSRHSGVPLFDLYINKPSHREYKAFLNSLAAYTEKARSFWQLRLDQQIAGEIRMLRRLASEGVVSQRDYDRAKDRLFKVSDKKSKVV